jgi:hypothetical protein
MSDEINTGASASTPAETPAPEINEAEEARVLEAAEAAEKVETPAQSAARKKKLQLKVDGKDEEMEIDLDNEEELRKHLQLSKVAQKRMQESAEMKKGFAGFVEALQKNPLQVLSDPRLNISQEQRRQLAEMIINGELEEMQKSPEQKEKERLQKEYETLKQQYENEKKAKQEADLKKAQETAARQYDQDISAAISEVGLPKNARTVKYMAEAMMFCLENDIALEPKDLAPMVKKHALKEFKEMISSLPDQDFEDWLGQDQITRIRKRTLQKLKPKVATVADVKPTGESDSKKREEEPKKIPMKEFWKNIGKF